MGFDSGGTFTRWGNSATLWAEDAAAKIKILSTRHDSHDQELANGLTECLTRTGKGVPAVDIPWGGKKITNLGPPTPNTSDAATTFYVDNLTGWSTSKYIDGADLNGRLNFTCPSGVNGITWTYADMSLVARADKVGEASNRLVINPLVAPNIATGVGDVVVFDEFGNINHSGKISNNLSWDGSDWRTIIPGWGSLLDYRTGGDFRLLSNDIATITNNYSVATLREFFTMQNNTGNAAMTLTKSAPFGAPLVQKYAYIAGAMGTPSNYRWLMYLGDSTAEAGGGPGRVGSDFAIYSYDNSGANPQMALRINRSTNLVTFPGAVTLTGAVTTGALTSTGTITADSNFTSSDTVLVLAAQTGGTIYIRPDGDIATQTSFSPTGDLVLQSPTAASTGGILAGKGLRSKAGSTATAYTAQWMNLHYFSGDVRVYVDAAYMGIIQWRALSDVRAQRNVAPLPSMWERIKALKPIQFQQGAFGDLYEDADIEQWGFSAHEVRDALTESAADGEPDTPGALQSTNAMTVIAALTKALQEAMQRIEALEAAA